MFSEEEKIFQQIEQNDWLNTINIEEKTTYSDIERPNTANKKHADDNLLSDIPWSKVDITGRPVTSAKVKKGDEKILFDMENLGSKDLNRFANE